MKKILHNFSFSEWLSIQLFLTVLVTPVKKTFFFLWDLGQTQLFKVNIEYFHIHSIGYGAVAIH